MEAKGGVRNRAGIERGTWGGAYDEGSRGAGTADGLKEGGIYAMMVLLETGGNYGDRRQDRLF